MEKITFCIPSKNNLRYLKSSIVSIKKNSLLENEIIVWVDSDNDGTEDWLKINIIRHLVIFQTFIKKNVLEIRLIII